MVVEKARVVCRELFFCWSWNFCCCCPSSLGELHRGALLRRSPRDDRRRLRAARDDIAVDNGSEFIKEILRISPMYLFSCSSSYLSFKINVRHRANPIVAEAELPALSYSGE